MSTKSQDCPRCGNCSRLQKRVFSDQATAALVVWNDLDERLVGEAICEDCYGELRDILIERTEDVRKIQVKKDSVRAS